MIENCSRNKEYKTKSGGEEPEKVKFVLFPKCIGLGNRFLACM